MLEDSASRPWYRLTWRGWMIVSLIFSSPVLFLSGYNIQARLAWEEHVRELEMMGETLDLEKLAPPEVMNDDENFARAPILVKLRDEARNITEPKHTEGTASRTLSPAGIPGYEKPEESKTVRGLESRELCDYFPGLSNEGAAQAVTRYFTEHATVIDEYRDALTRPKANFDFRYGDLLAAEFHDLNYLADTARLLQLHGKSAAILDDQEAVFYDTLDLLRLSEHAKSENTMIHKLVSIVILSQAISLVREGIHTNAWSNEFRSELERELREVEFASDFLGAARLERAMMVQTILTMRADPKNFEFLSSAENAEIFYRATRIASGWTYDNALTLSRVYQEELLTDPDGIILTDKLRKSNELKAILERSRTSNLRKFRSIIAIMSVPVIDSIRFRFLETDAMCRQTCLALLLAGYREKNGEYPDSLDAVLTDETDKLALDPMTDKPMIYQRLPNGEYQIYSVGANGIDEGGVIKKRRDEGDWVWRLSLPEDFDREAYFSGD